MRGSSWSIINKGFIPLHRRSTLGLCSSSWLVRKARYTDNFLIFASKLAASTIRLGSRMALSLTVTIHLHRYLYKSWGEHIHLFYFGGGLSKHLFLPFVYFCSTILYTLPCFPLSLSLRVVLTCLLVFCNFLVQACESIHGLLSDLAGLNKVHIWPHFYFSSGSNGVVTYSSRLFIYGSGDSHLDFTPS